MISVEKLYYSAGYDAYCCHCGSKRKLITDINCHPTCSLCNHKKCLLVFYKICFIDRWIIGIFWYSWHTVLSYPVTLSKSQGLLIILFDCLFIQILAIAGLIKSTFRWGFYRKQQCRVNLGETFFPLNFT